MKKWIAIAAWAIVTTAAHAAPISLSEGFDNLAASGWTIVNASSPVGVTSWFQGNAGVFGSQSGPADSYAAANFLSTDPNGGTVSTWLISPEIQFAYQVLSFFTRTDFDPDAFFGDGLVVRMSTSGASTSLADFSTVLFSVNAGNVAGAYPQDWTQFVTLLTSNVGTGRIAFEYSVSANALANYIGVDTVTLVVPEPPALPLALLSLSLLAWTLRRARQR